MNAAKLATEPYVMDGPSRSRISLVTMTKNGMEKLPRLFASVLGLVSLAVILDTGSTDGTQEWLRQQKFFPVELHEYPFTNFQDSRNMLMAFAQGKAEWLLLLDDDMELNFSVGYPDVVKQLKGDAMLMKHVEGIVYWVTRFVRGDKHWEYRGVTHEYLVGGNASLPKFEGVEILHHFNHGPEKFERDLRLLTADIARDPEDPRTIFYIANTLRDMGKIGPAIRFYCMRANMLGWDEEVYVSKYEAARLAEDPMAMEKAWESRPSRAEPAAWLALFWRGRNEKMYEKWEAIRSKIPMSNDALFVIPQAYE